jgi:hypothetical protein
MRELLSVKITDATEISSEKSNSWLPSLGHHNFPQGERKLQVNLRVFAKMGIFCFYPPRRL